ncbi:MAG: hypothetical protein IPQ18_14495 [Saprospiraceae bacterium]|nr:hypothetical protein [Saprospiraceae bacterium]
MTASGGGSLLWSTGSNSSVITVNPLVTTIYTVQVTGSNGCTATDEVMVLADISRPMALSGYRSNGILYR